MSQKDLWLQQFREVPIAQPTWFYHRSTWERIGMSSVQCCDISPVA
jgi:hypothetical protein